MHKPPVTRFAPSPTGYLHIGGARTALFNWLYAKANGGTYLLRIEDTDRERSTEDAINAILNGLSWLGLTSDQPPVYQHKNLARHTEIAQQLLSEGKAYKCYASKEELDAMRERARAAGLPPRYDGTWRDRDASEAPEGVSPVIRFKSPEHGITLKDGVQGEVQISGEELDDLILLRSDGTPTYMLSVVVDDHDMGITHIIRGDDHLTNAARQYQLYEALGWEPPHFSHIPLIHGSDGAKLSKRHGALSVEAYKDMGFLPEAMLNYLVRLGWSHGDDEFISREQMISWFGLEGIGKSPARFDMAKLEHVNKYYIRETADKDLLSRLLEFIQSQENGASILAKLDDEAREKLLKAMPALKGKAKTLPDLVSSAAFIWVNLPLVIEDKLQKFLDSDAQKLLLELGHELNEMENWTLDEIDTKIRKFAEDKGLKFGQIAQPLRAKLTGTTDSPAIFDVLYALGKKESLKRIKNEESA